MANHATAVLVVVVEQYNAIKHALVQILHQVIMDNRAIAIHADNAADQYNAVGSALDQHHLFQLHADVPLLQIIISLAADAAEAK